MPLEQLHSKHAPGAYLTNNITPDYSCSRNCSWSMIYGQNPLKLSEKTSISNNIGCTENNAICTEVGVQFTHNQVYLITLKLYQELNRFQLIKEGLYIFFKE